MRATAPASFLKDPRAPLRTSPASSGRNPSIDCPTLCHAPPRGRFLGSEFPCVVAASRSPAPAAPPSATATGSPRARRVVHLLSCATPRSCPRPPGPSSSLPPRCYLATRLRSLKLHRGHLAAPCSELFPCTSAAGSALTCSCRVH